MNTLVTGGCGFIGSNFIRLLLAERPERKIINLDLLTYAGHPSTVADLVGHPNYRFVQGDVADPQMVAQVMGQGIEEVVHFAAESHVDRSIDSPSVFLRTNVTGTAVLLEAARSHGIRRFLQIGTDEVYGHLGPHDPPFSEQTPVDPRSPYSASKAAADQLALAWHRTFGLPVLLTRCSNNYGPYQFPEKLIPLMIAKAMDHASLPVYGDGMNIRDWIHVEDHCRAVLAVLEKGEIGRVYNVGGDSERTNLFIVKTILAILGRSESLIRFVTDRPGHDWRYAMNAERIKQELGWAPRHNLDDALATTVEWYIDHESWWRPLLSRPRT
jgi:dTDP-glucose 4,6-dehydratase